MFIRFSIFFLVSFLGISANALEEVLVTGELRERSVLELANSVSVIDAEAIEMRHTQQLEDLFNLAPNVNYSSGASRGRFIQIRGIGERSQFVAPINPSVGVIVDGIDMTGISSGVSALDARQVEIFRGPQGTLYGANALAGMVNVLGESEVENAFGEISVGAGNCNALDARLRAGTRLGEHTQWRFAVQQVQNDGYIRNDYLQRKDTNNIDELSLRNALNFSLGRSSQLKLITYYFDSNNGYDAFSLDNNRVTLSDQPGKDTQRSLAHALHLHSELSASIAVQALASTAQSKTLYSYDEDWSYRTICAEDSDCAYWQYSTADAYQRDNDNTTLDLRLNSIDTNAFIDWNLGLYWRQQNVDLDRRYTNNDPDYDFYNPIISAEISEYSSDFQTRNSALYAQVQFNLSPALRLIAGLRTEQYQAEFSDSDLVAFSPDENFWGGKIALEFEDSRERLWYALISRGYKAGGFNPDPSLEEDSKEFSSEYMLNYEVGNKGLAFDDRLQWQSALFYQDRSDVQVKQSRAYAIDGAIDFIDFIDNAAEGINYGVEAEVAFALNDKITLLGNLGLLHTEYRDFINLSHVNRNADTGEGYDMNGREQAHAPSYQFFSALIWQAHSALSLRVEVEGKDGFYFSESHNTRSEAYTLVNLRGDYHFGDLVLSAWVKNVNDESIETRGFYFSNEFGNDPRKLYAPEPYTQKGAPRTLGIGLRYLFQ